MIISYELAIVPIGRVMEKKLNSESEILADPINIIISTHMVITELYNPSYHYRYNLFSITQQETL
jgi:hypothetical protein